MDDSFFVMLGLVALAVPIGVIVLFILQGGLRRRIGSLETRVAALTAKLNAPPVAALADAVSSLVVTDPAPQTAPAAPEAGFWPTTTSAATATPDPIQASAILPTNAPPAIPPVPSAPAPGPEAAPPPAFSGPIVLRADRASALGDWLKRNWVYVISAASLALAGIFLVQYGIQNGLLPPWLRVLAAYGFGATLIAAGEWLRRHEGDDEASDTAYLPSIFAGAGLVTLFAATIAARQLYEMIGPNLAFGLHLLTAALAIGLGWYYGPLLIAVGLNGAFAAPFLVGSHAAPTALLYLYYGLIGAVGLAVDAVRRWAWVSVLALVLAMLGAALMLSGGAAEAGWLAFTLVLPLLAVGLPNLRLVPGHPGPSILISALGRGKSGWPDFPVRLAGGTVLICSLAMMVLHGQTPLIGLLAFVALTLLAITLLIWAEKAEGLADLALLPAAAFLIRLMFEPLSGWPLAANFARYALDIRPPESPASYEVTWLAGLATVMTVAFAYRALRGGSLSLIHGLASVLAAPVAVALLELFWQPAQVLGPWNWALHAMVLAAAMVALAGRFARSDGADHRRMAYATLSALALIALALFLLTSATALTLALAVLAIAAAGLDRRFDLREMGIFIQIAVAVISYRLIVDPGVDWATGSAPLFAVLLAFLGAIAAEIAALQLLRGKSRTMTSGVLESAALALTAVLANVLLSRWLLPLISFTGQSATDFNYAVTLNAMPWLVLALTQAYRAKLGGALRGLRLALSALAGLIALAGLLLSVFGLNPLFAAYEDGVGAKVVGPMLLDTLAVAYAMPGIMLVLAAWWGGFPRRLSIGLISVGTGLLALYTGLEIRRFWQGDWLGRPGVSQYELYSYTVALMLIGAALLYQSIARRSATLRRIGMAVIVVTVAKVFLLDAAGLTGLTRVFSFLGLGLSLAGLAVLNRWAGQVAEK